MVKQCIHSFDTNRHTCIQCDWSKDGIDYVVLQQHCQYPTNTAPTCCPDGWRLVFAGSRFTTLTASCYAPTEGEVLAIAWSLNNAKMFVLGCKDLIFITDHKTLLNNFNHRELSAITNPRILKLKQKTLQSLHLSVLSGKMAQSC